MKTYETVTDIRKKMKSNLRARLSWFSGRLSSVRSLEIGRIMYIDSDQPSELLNAVSGIPECPYEVEIITRHYSFLHLRANWWMPTDIASPAAWWLAEYGWSIEDVLIGLAAVADNDLIVRLHGFVSPPELEIKPCNSLQRISDLITVRGSAFPKEAFRQNNSILNDMYSKTAHSILTNSGGFKAWLAYVDGRPVSAVTSIIQDQTAGIYDLITVPGQRCRSYGRATLLWAMKEALAEGCDLITCQASALNVKSCLAFGFVPINQFVTWNNGSS